jgi:hypothetical protein
MIEEEISIGERTIIKNKETKLRIIQTKMRTAPKKSRNQYRRENNYVERRNNIENNTNQNENNNENNHQGTYRPNFNNNSNNNQNHNKNNNYHCQNDHCNNNSNNNHNQRHGYNLRPRRAENHCVESDEESRSGNKSVSSTHSNESAGSQSSEESRGTYRTELSSHHKSHNIDSNLPSQQHDLEDITHQEVDYRREVVVSILQSTATKRKKIVRALVDTDSSRTIVHTRVLPSWVLSKASEDETCTYSTLSGSFQTNRKTQMALQLAQFAPHSTATHEVALLEDSATTRKDESKPDIIIGRDPIKALGLTLDFAAEPPTILWEDATVPIVPRGYWTKERL